MDNIESWLNRTFEEEQPKQNTSPPTGAPSGPPSNSQGANTHRPGSSRQGNSMNRNNRRRPGDNRGQVNNSPRPAAGSAPGATPAQGPRPQQGSAPRGNFNNRKPYPQRGPRPQGGPRPHARNARPQSASGPSTSKLRIQQKKFNRPPQRKHFINTEGEPKKLHNHPFLAGKLKVIPLGGLNEVGKNMMAFEYEDDIIIVDMGFEFPGEDMLGIDYIIPDVSYLEENKKKIRGVIITHAHLDHIGGVPYILPKLDFPPLFAAKLTIGLIKKKTEEFNQDKQAKLITINPDEPLRLGKFLCNFFRVVHSIPDSLGVIIDTPVGKLVHTGDFKFDENPAGFHSTSGI